MSPTFFHEDGSPRPVEGEAEYLGVVELAPEAPAPCECQPCTDRRRRKARRLPPENGDYAAALVRQIAAYGRRVGDGDPEDLTTALGVLEALEEAIAGAVNGLRAQGWSWATIGRAASDSDNPDGLTRQGAEQRWGR